MHDSENPYASARYASEHVEEGLEPPVAGVPFASGLGRARAAVIAFCCMLVTDLAAIVHAVVFLGLLEQLNQGVDVSEETFLASDTIYGGIGILQLLAYLATVVTFLMWFHRAHRNLPALGARSLKYTPGWAVGYFFIPIANLFIPCRVAYEIWNGSHPETIGRTFTEGENAPGASLVGLWWGAFIVGNVLTTLFTRASVSLQTMETAGIEEFKYSALCDIVGTGATIPAALLAITLIRRIDRNQRQRQNKIAGVVEGEWA